MMGGEGVVPAPAEDLHLLDRALADAPVPAPTRRALITRASLGLATLGSGALFVGCGSSQLTQSSGSEAISSGTGRQTDVSGEQLHKLLRDASTFEAFAVTFMNAAISQAAGTVVEPFIDELRAAHQSEYLHYLALQRMGATPQTTRFWIPTSLFGPQNVEVFTSLQAAEKLAVNLWLIATSAFASLSRPREARMAAEISAVEAEHLVLVNYALGQTPPIVSHPPPDDLAFTFFGAQQPNSILDQLTATGVGFGKKGTDYGQFMEFAPPPSDSTVSLLYPRPQ